MVKVNQTITTCDSHNVCQVVNHIAQGEQLEHTSAGGNGDSGGPVYASITQSTSAARGKLTAIDGSTSTQAPCTGVPTCGGRICSWRIFYPDVVNELADFSVSVITQN